MQHHDKLSDSLLPGVCPTGLPGIEPVVLTASLKHHFEAVGGNIVQITFEDTEVKVTGGIGGLLVSSRILCQRHVWFLLLALSSCA